MLWFEEKYSISNEYWIWENSWNHLTLTKCLALGILSSLIRGNLDKNGNFPPIAVWYPKAVAWMVAKLKIKIGNY